MRETIFTPDMRDGGVVVWYTEAFILDKGMKITVPNQYTAVVFDNEKIAFRVEPCVGKILFKEYGKELLGHNLYGDLPTAAPTKPVCVCLSKSAQ